MINTDPNASAAYLDRRHVRDIDRARELARLEARDRDARAYVTRRCPVDAGIMIDMLFSELAPPTGRWSPARVR